MFPYEVPNDLLFLRGSELKILSKSKLIFVSNFLCEALQFVAPEATQSVAVSIIQYLFPHKI